jgi:hypothetical protein
VPSLYLYEDLTDMRHRCDYCLENPWAIKCQWPDGTWSHWCYECYHEAITLKK